MAPLKEPEAERLQNGTTGAVDQAAGGPGAAMCRNVNEVKSDP